MSKDKKRGNREAKKPKQEKAAPKPATLVDSRNKLAVSTIGTRVKSTLR